MSELSIVQPEIGSKSFTCKACTDLNEIKHFPNKVIESEKDRKEHSLDRCSLAPSFYAKLTTFWFYPVAKIPKSSVKGSSTT